MSDEHSAEPVPPETQATVERIKRWATEPGTALLGSSSLPRMPGGIPFSLASSDGKEPGLSALQSAPLPAQTKPTAATPELLEHQARLQELAVLLAERIAAELPPLVGTQPSAAQQTERRQLVRTRAQAFLQESADLPSRIRGPEEANLLFALVEQDLLGYGPLDSLMADQEVTEILVVGPTRVFVDRAGNVHETAVRFQHEAHLLRIIRTLLPTVGQTTPFSASGEEGRLPDGSQVQVLLPPSAVNGPILAIRKAAAHPRWQMEELLDHGMLSPAMAALLYGAVLARLNIVIAGGASSGKTTLLNTLCDFIPDNERIVTIEEATELQLSQRQVVRLEARAADVSGTGRGTVSELVTQAVRLRPQRLLVGDCHGGETFELLQALNAGQDGVMMTVYASTPQDCLHRLETQAMLAGRDVPVLALRRQIANAVQFIVQLARLRDGSCKITHIAEVQGRDDQLIHLQEVFRYKETGRNATDQVQGVFEPSGVKPLYYPRLEQVGVPLPPSFFVREQHRQPERWEALPWE